MKRDIYAIDDSYHHISRYKTGVLLGKCSQFLDCTFIFGSIELLLKT